MPICLGLWVMSENRLSDGWRTTIATVRTWSMDFVSDTLNSGRKFRVLNILDDFNREAVAQEISMSMPAERVIRRWLLEDISATT